MNAAAPRTVLFHRDFRTINGGHLKVWHYYHHVRDTPGFETRIHFTRRSRLGGTNPWRGSDEIVPVWSPGDADVLFLAGLDWDAVPLELRDGPDLPVLNLIQGLRHADPADPRHRFLRHRAIRICVGEAVAEAVGGDPTVNGPVFHVPMGIDRTELPLAGDQRNDVLIAAVKAPKTGRQLRARLRRPGRRVELLTKRLPRHEYLRSVAESRVVVFLPLPFEGFYLPALEAMAMRRIVVCPDIPSAREYCRPGRNCFRPDYDVDPIVDAAEAAAALDDAEATTMGDQAAATGARYSLERERESFLGILRDLDALWQG